MEKKKTNKIHTIIILLLLITIIIFTIYKLNKNHEEKLYNVMYKKIEYNSYKCYLDKKCNDSFTLEDLYENKYLDTMYDPITKEELKSNTSIKILNDKVIIEKKNQKKIIKLYLQHIKKMIYFYQGRKTTQSINFLFIKKINLRLYNFSPDLENTRGGGL